MNLVQASREPVRNERACSCCDLDPSRAARTQSCIGASSSREPVPNAGFYTNGRPLVKSKLICPSDKLS